ncbi:ATP-dependent DNA helicase [Lagierella sp.]|uniref:ATP-dependent DNA helicase n=1 Tax=Lagierella sp. TaxID=2849657 RepID=UPI00261A6C63|nr:ATP-dependent DNA helicase [Lagierella sp.]
MEDFKLSVRGLIEFVMRSGDIDSSFTDTGRLREGQKIHSKLQKEYGEFYEKEVYLKNETFHKELLFKVEGRADGIYRKGNEVLIDEIKTTTRPLNQLEYNTNPLHWSQAKCYGYFYAIKEGLDNIDIQLTYYNVDEKDIKRIIKNFSFSQLEEFYLNLLDLYLDFSIMIVNFRKNRDEHINSLPFPFPVYRKGQRELAVAVYNVLKSETRLFVEAPTGIGKTMSTVFPSIKAIGNKLTDKVFYLTARTTTKNEANKAVLRLMDRGLLLKTLTITAKEKICINDEVKCNPKDCPFAKGHYDRVNDAIFDIYENEDVLNMETIVSYSKKHKVCPMEFQLDMANFSDLIICDYNYCFDPTVYLRRFFEGSVEKYTFLVDEAHNLVDRGRRMYSEEISLNMIEETASLFDEKHHRIQKKMFEIANYLKTYKSMLSDRGEYVEKNLDEDFITKLNITLRAIERFLVEFKDASYYDRVLETYFELRRFFKISDYYSKNYVTVVKEEDLDIKMKFLCLDTSPIFKDILKRAESTVFFSATLSPMDFYVDVFGCKTSTYYRLKLPSPFDPNNFKVGIAPISTRYLDRIKNYDIITKVLEKYTNRPGNYLLFFPSYKFMMEVFDRFNKKDRNLILQEKGMTEMEREAFLSRFTFDSNITGFVVLGGVFSEGIDLAGSRLKGVGIVSVGLPGISLERDLIKKYYDENDKIGFEYAYIYPGMNKVSQGGGRVIRTAQDIGDCLLIDDRFLKYPYKNLIPRHWKNIRILEKPRDLNYFD